MFDLHTHSYFCDGKDSPEKMILSAIEKGLDCIGICTHSYVPFDEEYCIPLEKYDEFKKEINRLKVKYADKIKVLCGVEQDYYSDVSTEGFDYIIGSVHYLNIKGEYIPLDSDPQILEKLCSEHFNSEAASLAEAYYSLVSKLQGFDIVGHIDLITKFNEKNPMFDTSDERYIKAWKNAVNKLLQYDKPFEINTGAISRSWRTTPYPATDIAEYILSNGGRLILSSDSHNSENIAFKFFEYASYPVEENARL